MSELEQRLLDEDRARRIQLNFNPTVLEEDDALPPLAKSSSSLDCIWNFTNVILGAGMFALPRVFAALGLIGGALLVILVALMTYSTVTILLLFSEVQHGRTTTTNNNNTNNTNTDDTALYCIADRTNTSWTYASALHSAWGRKAAAAVHAAVIIGGIGFVALYMVLVADVLLGNSVYTGIISDLFPQLPDPLPWYLSRTALLTWIALAAAPLLSAHSLHGMAHISLVSVASSIMSMLCLVVLWGGAWYRGMLAPLRLWPSLAFFGSQPMVIAINVIGIVPVVMTAFLCHMSVHPISRDLGQYTPSKIRTAVAWSMVVCTAVYCLTGGSGFWVFGDSVAGDVLSNVQPEAVAEIFGCSDGVGLAFVAVLKIFVAISMLTSIPINLWPMREDVMGLLTTLSKGRQPSTFAFYSVTYLSLTAIWATAVAVESAYSLIGVVGAVCGVAMGFLFPGLLAWKLKGVVAGAEIGGGALVVAGIFLMVAGVVSTMMNK